LISACAGPAKEPTTRPDEGRTPATPTDVATRAPQKVLTADEAYAQAIPATVLVTTAWGHGTGVIVDPKGLVLTNYHVVATGKDEDFGITATVTIPTRHPDGSVTPGERFQAVALEVDEKRDLALLAIQGANRTFPALEVSAKDPQPGTRVFALGNAGVGLGWALKRCSINAIGTLDEQVSAIFQMQREEVSAEERARTEEAIRKAAKDAGRQIQTDCSILPGDSGGPLVDETSGHVVGLNVAIRTAFSQFASLGSLAFHIHGAELRDFLKDVPKTPQVFLPDPWVSAGSYGALVDFDQDGEIDSLTFQGSCGDNQTCQVAFADVDENSFRRKKTLPTPAEIQTSREFDAELAILKLGRMPRKPKQFPTPVSDTLAWIDGDDDGKFEKLLVVDGETGGTRGYSLGEGRPVRDKALDGVSFANLADQYAKASVKPEIGRFSAALLGGTVELSDPEKIKAVAARLADYTDDKKPDTLHIETRLDRRVLIDVEQKRLTDIRDVIARSGARRPPLRGRVSADPLLRRVREGKVKGDLLVVLGAPTRVYYDTNADGEFDLVLEGASIDSGIALGAAAIDGQGRLSPVPQHLGRRLLRPGLLNDAKRAATLEKVIGKALPTAPHANAKDDASSFPSPLPKNPLGATPVGFGNSVLSVSDGDGVVILMDLDEDTFAGKNAKKDPLEVVKAGKFDAELAVRFGNGIAWAFYDGNDDGKFDAVFIAAGWDPKRIAIAYKLGKKTAEVDTSRAGGAMLDPKMFKGAKLQKRMAEVASKLFP